MSVVRLEVSFLDHQGHLDRWCNEAREFLDIPLEGMEQVNFYTVESQDKDLLAKLAKVGAEVFCDTIIQRFHLENTVYDFPHRPACVVEVTFRPGVTDNPGHAAREALSLTGIDANVASGSLYFLFGQLNLEQASRVALEILANDLIQKVDILDYKSFCDINRFEKVALPKVNIQSAPTCTEISLDISDLELVKLSQDNCLALSLEEMKYIKNYFLDSEHRAYRQKNNLPRWPTDVELEILAQSWSEHCKHKIFAAEVFYQEENIPDGYKKMGDQSIQGLYPSFIKSSTKKIEKERNLSWLISVFSDNAGIVRFDKNVDLCVKVETHNSPSALDPYGGALTGILGVNRDILGCGMGARPIANMDVFCFANPDMPSASERELMPKGLKAPRRIFEGVHRGVEDGGNKSGIPTVNGAIYFDQDYAGKPLVFCGTVGVIPSTLASGLQSGKKYLKNSHKIVMVGGAIGADGIHGATFSSLELSENSPSTAVQIGDPLTQKRVMDFLMEARDLGLYTAITDNGAGGLSSSVGEMATFTNGATIDLSKAPVKYPGLKPFELMISESQERMTVAVEGKNLDQFLSLGKRRGVVATDIGEFNNSGRFRVFYGKELVADMDLHFIHESLPALKLIAKWDGPRDRKLWISRGEKKCLDNFSLKEIALKLLSSPNIASKEAWVRRYDHEVQAATHIKPFVGECGDGPSDCGAIWLYPHGGERDNVLMVACGLNPKMSLYDTYLMAQFSVDEAVRNVVVAGGSIDHLALLDNFCWPDPVASVNNPDGEYKMAQLVRACRGLYDICNDYGTPLISGKDSMKNDFRGKNHRGQNLVISILPTLLVTAISKGRISSSVTTNFKSLGDLIYVLGKESCGLGASQLSDLFEVEDKIPEIDLNANKNLYKRYGNAHSMICSAHDISDGGLLIALLESAIGGRLGFNLILQENELIDYLFNEGPGRFCVTIKAQDQKAFEGLFDGISFQLLGVVTKEGIRIENKSLEVLNSPLDEFIQAFKRGLQ